jgi:hypothetical protein
MTSEFEVSIQFDAFVTAASQVPKMKRAPRGIQGSIPSDTLLSSDSEGIKVETSTVSSLVRADKEWRTNVSVDAKKLIEVCAALKKLGAGGQSIKVDIQGRQLCFVFRTTKISIPTLWVK